MSNLGRPKVPENVKLTYRVSVSVSERQLERWLERAAAKGYPGRLPQYIRVVVDKDVGFDPIATAAMPEELANGFNETATEKEDSPF